MKRDLEKQRKIEEGEGGGVRIAIAPPPLHNYSLQNVLCSWILTPNCNLSCKHLITRSCSFLPFDKSICHTFCLVWWKCFCEVCFTLGEDWLPVTGRMDQLLWTMNPRCRVYKWLVAVSVLQVAPNFKYTVEPLKQQVFMIFLA